MAPTGETWAQAVEYWKSLPSDPTAKFDVEVTIAAGDVIPTVTWGTSPQDVVPIDGVVPDPAKEENPNRRAAMERSLEYMGLQPNTPMTKIAIDKVAPDCDIRADLLLRADYTTRLGFHWFVYKLKDRRPPCCGQRRHRS